MQDDNLKSEQKLIVNSMLRTSTVLSNLINDAMDYSTRDDGRFPLEMKPFGLHAMVKEAACLAKCMCVYRVIGFVVDVDKSLPDNVIGDEKRVFQVILHMVGNAINGNHGGGVLVFRVFAETGSQGRNDQGWTTWRPSSSGGDVNIRFEIGINNGDPELESSVPSGQLAGTNRMSDKVEERLSFSICKRIIQVSLVTLIVYGVKMLFLIVTHMLYLILQNMLVGDYFMHCFTCKVHSKFCLCWPPNDSLRHFHLLFDACMGNFIEFLQGGLINPLFKTCSLIYIDVCFLTFISIWCEL